MMIQRQTYKDITEWVIVEGTQNKEEAEKNKLLIKEFIEEEGRKLLILSDRIEHLNVLHDSVNALNITTTSYYIGGMKEYQRNIAAKCDIIFATYEMAAEGLDIDSLNTLVLAYLCGFSSI